LARTVRTEQGASRESADGGGEEEEEEEKEEEEEGGGGAAAVPREKMMRGQTVWCRSAGHSGSGSSERMQGIERNSRANAKATLSWRGSAGGNADVSGRMASVHSSAACTVPLAPFHSAEGQSTCRSDA
jgi:hypothetical protein